MRVLVATTLAVFASTSWAHESHSYGHHGPDYAQIAGVVLAHLHRDRYHRNKYHRDRYHHDRYYHDRSYRKGKYRKSYKYKNNRRSYGNRYYENRYRNGHRYRSRRGACYT